MRCAHLVQKEPLFTILTYMDGPHGLLYDLGNAAVSVRLKFRHFIIHFALPTRRRSVVLPAVSLVAPMMGA